MARMLQRAIGRWEKIYKAGWIWKVVRAMKRLLVTTFLTALPAAIMPAEEVPAVIVPGTGALLLSLIHI